MAPSGSHDSPILVPRSIRGGAIGFMIFGGSPMLEGNTITGSTTGLRLVGRETTPILSSNTICDNETNLAIASGAEMPDTEGNEICQDALAAAAE
jgi:parallel beta-helix repeat protein